VLIRGIGEISSRSNSGADKFYFSKVLDYNLLSQGE
jgi:hypothetical protein